MTQLSQQTLASLPANIVRAGYDRSKLTAGIVHVGVGAFHRAHMSDNLQWGEIGLGLLPFDIPMRDALKKQDYLFTVNELAPNGTTVTRVVENIVDFMYAPDDVEAALQCLSSPNIRIVSLTITEGGYLMDNKGRFRIDDPKIVHDLANRSTPQTVFGFIMEALDRRRRAGIKPFTVMSCDNVRHNGDTAKKACLAFANARDKELAAWIQEHVSFPNGMVDRITPAMDAMTKQSLNDKSGVQDAAPVICEDFIQWVLEDNFCAGRPDWDKAGVMLTKDVTPYEEAKIRLLNGTHLMMAYPTYLAGLRKVDEALRDQDFLKYLRDFLDEDAGPWLPSLPGMDLSVYKQTLLDRFSNRAIGDQLARLCLDGGSKIPGFVLPSLNACLDKGVVPKRIAFFLASYNRYLRAGADEFGQTFVLNEPNAMHVLEQIIKSDDALALIHTPEIVGTAAPANRDFVDCYLKCYESICANGVRKTLQNL